MNIILIIFILLIDIRIQQRSTKKCLTLIEGIPEDIDLPKVLKAWKKVLL